MTRIVITFTNGTTLTREVRTTAMAEVARDLDNSPNVESWHAMRR